jgi:hypothetical protein
LSAILEKFESIMQHVNETRRDSAQRTVIEELSRMKSRIGVLEENFGVVAKRTEQIGGINDALKAIQNSSEMRAMRAKVSSIEQVLVNLKTINAERHDNDMHRASSSSSSSGSGGDDFVTKAMISIIFVIVCGFIVIYIIKLYARRRYKCNDFRTYSDGDTIDENIL